MGKPKNWRYACVGFLAVLATTARAETIVTLTFDDSRASQRQVNEILAPHGMKATFFVITGKIGNDKTYMTVDDLRALEAAGHEIGGHTITHRYLPDLSPEEQRREICGSREQLVAWGFEPTSFAYPLSGYTPEIERMVADCGYTSARRTSGISSCAQCPPAESIPPADLFAIRTTASVNETHTLADLQGWVLEAERAGGGWVNLVFHKQGDPCTGVGTCSSPTLLREFVEWLALREPLGTRVKTVQEVIHPESAARLKVVFPNGGETLTPDTEEQVTWTSGGRVPEVDVAFTTDEGATWSHIATVPNTGSVPWRIPALPWARVRLRVSSATDGAVFDTSDAPFLIVDSAGTPKGTPPSGLPSQDVTQADGGTGDASPPPTSATLKPRMGCGEAGASLGALVLLALLPLRRTHRGG